MLKPVLILVIDDIDTNLFMLSTLLKREGFGVISAASGPEGRKLAEEKKPDLILLDIIMPDETGFRTCELLKKNTETAGIPVVFLSALEDTDSKIKGLAIGAADFVSKPFMKEEILVRIRSQVRLRRSQSLLAENLGALLLSRENGDPHRESVFEQVEIADGIHGFFFSRAVESDEDSFRALKTLKYLIPNVATPLLSPDEAMRLINLVFRQSFPDLKALPAAYFVYNRNASRLSVTLAGEVTALVANSASSASYCGRTGDVLASQENPFLHRLDYPLKPGARVCAYLALIERDDKKEAFRNLFLSTISASIEDQRNDLVSFIETELMVSADNRLFLFETI
ncbi:MAG: response regulator [Treponemataceae bacterium]